MIGVALNINALNTIKIDVVVMQVFTCSAYLKILFNLAVVFQRHEAASLGQGPA